MAMTINYHAYLALLPQVKSAPQGNVWLSYDADADVLYINFRQPNRAAADSELTDDDVIVRYDTRGEVIGLTVLHASQR